MWPKNNSLGKYEKEQYFKIKYLNKQTNDVIMILFTYKRNVLIN